MYALHPDKLVSVTRILARRRPTAPADGSNLVERLAGQLHAASTSQLSASDFNPVAVLGHQFRHVTWPQPRIQSGVDGTVVIPGGRKPHKSAIPAGKI